MTSLHHLPKAYRTLTWDSLAANTCVLCSTGANLIQAGHASDLLCMTHPASAVCPRQTI